MVSISGKKSWRLSANVWWTAAAVVLLSVSVNPPEHSAVILLTQTEFCTSCMQPKHQYPAQDAHWSTILIPQFIYKVQKPWRASEEVCFFFLSDQFCFLTRAWTGEQKVSCRRGIFLSWWNQVKYCLDRRFFLLLCGSSSVCFLYFSDRMLVGWFTWFHS